MKKTLIIVMMVIVTLLSIQTVYASQPTNSRNLFVEYDDEELEGHIDLLVLKSELSGYYTSEVNMSFRQEHPNYQSYDYLDDGEWVSFCAHIESSTCRQEYWISIFEHVNIDVLPDVLSSIKLVYIDENGDTITISDTIEVPNERFYQERDIRLYFNTITFEFEANVHIYTSLFFAIGLFIVAIFSVIISVVKSLIHNRQGLQPKITNKTLHYLYILIVTALSLTSFLLLYGYLNNQFIMTDSIIPILGLIIGCFTVEAFISYFLLYDSEQLYLYIRYAVLSNVAAASSIILIFSAIVF